MKYPLVVIIWKDHTGHTDWVSDDKEIATATALHTIHSVGWLYQETEEKYVLIGATGVEGGISAIQTIGKGMVVSISTIKRKRNGRGKD